jgi:hypothetical protein
MPLQLEMCVWRSPDRKTGWTSADVVGDRLTTGSAHDYADPHWNTVGLVAAHEAGFNVTPLVGG